MSVPREVPSIAQRSPRRSWAWAGLVGLAALAAFGYRLSSEPHFADESAFISQSYFADLWLSGDVDNPEWLTWQAVDLTPLPKYLIGIALRIGGYRRPGPLDAYKWYNDISYRPESAAMLWAARWPSVFLGAAGCVAIYALGTLAAERKVGLLAAFFLMVDPLYRMHARRAMSDVPAEALILATAAAGLWAWQRTLAKGGVMSAWLAAAAAGMFAGLAVLCKLNGVLGLIIMAVWVLCAAVLPRFAAGRKLALAGAWLVAACVAFGTFVTQNPFMTAHPSDLPPRLSELAGQSVWARAREIVEHRLEVSSGQLTMFPHNALRSVGEKVKAVAVQGFGRFGPLGSGRFDPRTGIWAFDSTLRFDWEQDRGAVIWGPCVVIGMIWAFARGRSQLRAGEPPTAWAILIQALVALLIVTALIPLAWDRYYLSIQPGSALLVAGVAVAAAGEIVRWVVGREEA
jgi:4-amino-4-deoxy-L-arabinose transferase-like glycosyltransferase